MLGDQYEHLRAVGWDDRDFDRYSTCGTKRRVGSMVAAPVIRDSKPASAAHVAPLRAVLRSKMGLEWKVAEEMEESGRILSRKLQWRTEDTGFVDKIARLELTESRFGHLSTVEKENSKTWIDKAPRGFSGKNSTSLSKCPLAPAPARRSSSKTIQIHPPAMLHYISIRLHALYKYCKDLAISPGPRQSLATSRRKVCYNKIRTMLL